MLSAGYTQPTVMFKLSCCLDAPGSVPACMQNLVLGQITRVKQMMRGSL